MKQIHLYTFRKKSADYRCFKIQYKNEISKIINILGNIPDKISKFITKKQKEVHNQSGNSNDRYKPSNKMRFKTSILQ